MVYGQQLATGKTIGLGPETVRGPGRLLLRIGCPYTVTDASEIDIQASVKSFLTSGSFVIIDGPVSDDLKEVANPHGAGLLIWSNQ